MVGQRQILKASSFKYVALQAIEAIDIYQTYQGVHLAKKLH